MKKTVGHIRFGVICSATNIFAWQESVIRKLVSEADAELKLVVFEDGQIGQKSAISSVRHYHDKPGLLWKMHYRHIVGRRSKALKEVAITSVFEGIPSISCTLIETGGFAKLKDADTARIKAAALDFILDFSSTSLSGNVLKAAKFGVWSFRFGDQEKYSGCTPCFWEIYKEDVLSKASLIRLTNEKDTFVLLKEGCLKTSISYPKNVDKIHFESANWPSQLCQDIKNNQTKNLSNTIKLEQNIRLPAPSGPQLLNFLLIQLRLFAKKATKSIFYTDYWNIGIAHSPIHEFLNSQKIPEVQWFSDVSKNRFMADPFGIYFNGDLHIIYEDLSFKQRIGKTARFLFKENSFTENKIVIDEKFHMSYPFLFEHESAIFCIPETYQANQVRLYRALEFPDQWQFEKVLIDNYAGIDSTLFKHEDMWYLFSTNKNSGPHYNLNIHYSANVFGPWQEHPKNPVKTDIRSARPAGTIFEHNGDIFRPSMDYSERIEGRIIINKIVTLTISDFKEEMHNIVNPFEDTFFSDKVHTLSQVGKYTLVDGAKELLIFSNINAFKYKISRILDKLMMVLCGFVVF